MSYRPDNAETGSAAPEGEGLGSADTIISLGSDRPEPSILPDTLVGERLSARYHVLKLLGAGGMGAVYLARDYELDELIALKVLREVVAASQDAIALLRQEVRLARRVTHRNVARIFELGEYQGQRFLTMEYIDGQSLSGLMKQQGRLPLVRTAGILAPVCHGLQAAHDASVVHCDIKPDNVLVAHSGRVVISDFGIARAAQGGQRRSEDATPAGTPAYMAPEQLGGEDVTTRSDVYSLGVMAFEMLTGELPWKYMDPARGRLLAPPPDPRQVVPELSEAVARLIVRAMARQPQERITSPAAFAADLLQAVTSVTARVQVSQGIDPSALVSMPTPPSADSGAAKRAVAVLPFQNRGQDEDDYLASGFTEDLIDCLCAVNELRVLSRGATARFAGDVREAHEIGRELGVSIVVEGSIERADKVVQLRLRAIDTVEGVQRWATRYRVASEDILTASEEVARQLTASLVSSGAQQQSPRPSGISSAAAVEAYLRAKEAYRRFGSIDDAVGHYEDALRLAGDSPLVNAGYAMTLLRAWMITAGQDGDESLPVRARKAAERALAAAPNMGEPHMALGLLHLHHGDPVGAVREFRTTISLSPSMAEAHAFLGELLTEIGRVPEGLLRLDTASRIDPTLYHPNGPRRRVAALLKDWDRAYALSSHAPPVQTPLGHMLTLRIAAYRGDRDYVARIAEQVAAMRRDSYGMKDWVEAQLDAYLGRRPMSEIYEILYLPGKSGSVSLRRLANQYQVAAEVAGFAGDHDVVIDAIDKSLGMGLVDLLWFDHCPFLDKLRGDARFMALRARLQERAYAAYDAFWS
jgi:eukaryotic-like serine/threonine-protein kinase